MWKNYKKLKNKVTAEIRKAKRKYYCENLTGNQNRNKSWTLLSSIVPNSRSSSSIPIIEGDVLKTANKFNSHVAVDTLNVDSSEQDVNSRLDNPVSPNLKQDLKLYFVTEEEVLNELRKFPNKKSVGVDGISQFILKLAADEIIKPITYLINK